MKILVVGGSGFLGKYCLDYLAEYDVVSIDRSVLDIYNHEKVKEFLEEQKFTHLLFLAWPHTPPHNQFEHITFAKVTLEFMRIFAVINNTARIVMVGSIHEASKNIYGLSKSYVHAVTEVMLDELSKHITFCWVRLANVYGPGDHQDKLIVSMIKSLVRGINFDLANPTKSVDFVHVKDAANGIVLALLSNYHGDINIGSGSEYCLKDIKDMVENIIKKTPTDLIRINGRTLDISKAIEILQYQPTISIKDGITEEIKNYAHS